MGSTKSGQLAIGKNGGFGTVPAPQRVAAERSALVDRLTQAFDDRVQGVVKTVASQADQMQASAQSMSATAEETTRQASAVAAASEQSSANVQTVASAAEELSSSIVEISRQITACRVFPSL